MTRRFDASSLLRADAFVAKGEAKAPKAVAKVEEEMLSVSVPLTLKNRLKFAAIEQRTTVRKLVMKALADAGYSE